MSTVDMSDPMSMILQHAARREDKLVFPHGLVLSENTDKVLNQLVRKGFLMRQWVKAGQPMWKHIRGSGNTNLKITKAGYKAIGWK